MAVICFALVCLLARCSATVIEFTGTMDFATGEVLPGLSFPAPYEFTILVDVAALAAAEDEEPSPYLGHFDVPGSWTISLPGYEFSGNDLEFNVWAGYNGNPDNPGPGLNYAFVIGNGPGTLQHGFDLADYGAYWQIIVDPSAVPDDSLANIKTIEPRNLSRGYMEDRAHQVNSATGRIIRDENVETMTVREVVPEPEPWGLAVLGAAALSQRRRRG